MDENNTTKQKQQRRSNDRITRSEPDDNVTDETRVRKKKTRDDVQICFDPDKEEAHPFVQNSRPRERNTACYSLGPNALLIVLLVSSVQPQHEFGESRKLVCHHRTC